MNPGGTPTGVTVGLAAAVVVKAGGDVVTAGVGSAAGVRVARFTTAITDATAITTATIATVANPRRSHLPDGLGADSAFATFAAAGSSGELGGDGRCSSATSSGRGASLGDRLSSVS